MKELRKARSKRQRKISENNSSKTKKKQLRNNFAEQTKERDDVIVKKELIFESQKANQELLKKKMNDYIKES